MSTQTTVQYNSNANTTEQAANILKTGLETRVELVLQAGLEILVEIWSDILSQQSGIGYLCPNMSHFNDQLLFLALLVFSE